MNQNNLWSLRLGFSSKQADAIEELGLKAFLKKSFESKFDTDLPECLKDDPKSLGELKALRKEIKNADSEAQKKILKRQLKNNIELKNWWLDKIQNEAFPLREKMVLFWHNHFVATAQKVKVNYWVYQHNMILRESAFGNFKELTKAILKSNAMVRYLDNVDNKKGNINENLSRELLELFTLGIGNYNEDDIKNGAKALAGLGLGEDQAIYRRVFRDNSSITYLGKTGHFDADDLVDIIFEQPNIPYRITKKILQWFIYDNPPENLVTYYGNYFKKNNFEIAPLLTKIFTEEFSKNTAGSKIKDPLLYILQMTDELKINNMPNRLIAFFIKQQGMDLFNQPNVKGWDGGNSWLSSQIYLQRNNASDLLCNGKKMSREATESDEMQIENKTNLLNLNINWDKNGTNKKIIQDFKDKLLFDSSEEAQKDMENILKYDFDATDAHAKNGVLRLFNYITKLPEFQLI
jgi:uncharacterized protein (DUF1800 family)